MTQKQCKNGCGRIIEWNNDLHYFEEVATSQRHMCPNWQSKQTSTFEQNKKMYAGPTDQVQTEVANLVADISVMKQQILSLQQSVNGLGEAIAKVSFTTANKLEDTEPEEIIDESTN